MNLEWGYSLLLLIIVCYNPFRTNVPEAEHLLTAASDAPLYFNHFQSSAENWKTLK